MAYEMRWESGGVYWKYNGIVTGEEIIEASTAVYGDARFDELKYKLVDFLDVSNFQVDKEHVAEIACQHLAAAKSNPGIRNAIVLRPKDNELVSYFISFLTESPWEVRVFHDLEAADAWLGR